MFSEIMAFHFLLFFQLSQHFSIYTDYTLISRYSIFIDIDQNTLSLFFVFFMLLLHLFKGHHILIKKFIIFRPFFNVFEHLSLFLFQYNFHLFSFIF